MKLKKGGYASITIMLVKKTFLVVGINIELVKMIKLSISEHNLTIMPCHCHRRFLF